MVKHDQTLADLQAAYERALDDKMRLHVRAPPTAAAGTARLGTTTAGRGGSGSGSAGKGSSRDGAVSSALGACAPAGA